jgi:membrane associated rhomboid family serine protease
MIVLYVENQHLIQAFNSLSLAQQDAYRNAFTERIDEATLGASGAVFGCLAAFGYLFPNDYVYFSFLIPIKAKWFVMIYAGYELFQAIQNSAGDNVAHVAHLGGALFGIILVWFWNKNNRRNFY